jgi:hypothetical protein
VTAIKHSKIDDARSQASIAQSRIRRFRHELADVNVRCQAAVQIGGFARFADYFFDGLIADWYVQSKIGRSKESVSRAQRQVRSALGKLRRALDGVRTRKDELVEERRRLIEGA